MGAGGVDAGAPGAQAPRGQERSASSARDQADFNAEVEAKKGGQVQLLGGEKTQAPPCKEWAWANAGYTRPPIDVSDRRGAEITRWADKFVSRDPETSKRVHGALAGKSELKQLTDAEKRYLVDVSLEKLEREGEEGFLEAWDLLDHVKDDRALKAMVGERYASRAARLMKEPGNCPTHEAAERYATMVLTNFEDKVGTAQMELTQVMNSLSPEERWQFAKAWEGLDSPKLDKRLYTALDQMLLERRLLDPVVDKAYTELVQSKNFKNLDSKVKIAALAEIGRASHPASVTNDLNELVEKNWFLNQSQTNQLRAVGTVGMASEHWSPNSIFDETLNALLNDGGPGPKWLVEGLLTYDGRIRPNRDLISSGSDELTVGLPITQGSFIDRILKGGNFRSPPAENETQNDGLE
jgi:hypothetical protein